MSWRELPPSDKQIKLLRSWHQDIPKTRGECSDIIGKWKDKQKYMCRKCRKLLEAVDGKLTCCGITENESRAIGTPVIRGGNRDEHGRLHGQQPTFGSGEIQYNHGVMTYLDDGNGNVYDWDEELDSYNDTDFPCGY